jgi:YVTN family beta-propeller protein
MRLSRIRLGELAAAVLLATPVLVLCSPSGFTAAATIAGGATAGLSAGHQASRSARAGVVGNVATIGVGQLPTSVAIDPLSGTVWVVNSLSNTVSEISAASRAVIATIDVGMSPVDVAVDQKTGTVWVTCLGPYDDPSADNTVSEISEASRKVIATIKVGLVPFGIAADSRTGTVWVANTNSDTVSEISEARQEVVATINTGPGAAPVSLATDPGSGLVWVDRPGGPVQEISEATKSVVGSTDVSPGAGSSSLNAIVVDPDTGAAWVASDFYSGGSYVSYASAVAPAARRVTAGVLVSKPQWYTNIADGIAVDPATGTVWVAENGGDTVTLISGGAEAVARNLATGDGPVAVAVDSRTGTVWIVNNGDDTVTEYTYASPEFTTSPQAKLVAGRPATVTVLTRGFPLAAMRVDGPVPAGMRVRIGQGSVVISGRPALSARNHTFPVVVSADNGVGTASGQYVFTQQLVIEVS